jgi:carbamoyl-phosphate synthase large subunit
MPADGAPERARVLVTGTGGPSGVGVMRALAGAAVDIVSGDIDPYAAGLYLVPEADRVLLPRGDDPGFVDAIVAHCEQRGIDVVVPTVDTELLPLALRRDELLQQGIRLVLASADTLRCCLDKWTLLQRCAPTVRVPASAVIDEHFDAGAWPLPAIVKPRAGSGSRGVRLVRERAELDTVPRDGTLLAQEHLPGLEHSLDVLARADGRVVAVVPRARLKIDSGIAVTGRTIADPALQDIGRAVAERIGLTTVANVQVKADAEGNPALLEVNARFPGTMPLTVASGINMPRLAVEEALGTPIPDELPPFKELAMVRFLDDRFFGLDELARAEAAARAVAGGDPVSGAVDA